MRKLVAAAVLICHAIQSESAAAEPLPTCAMTSNLGGLEVNVQCGSAPFAFYGWSAGQQALLFLYSGERNKIYRVNWPSVRDTCLNNKLADAQICQSVAPESL